MGTFRGWKKIGKMMRLYHNLKNKRKIFLIICVHIDSVIILLYIFRQIWAIFNIAVF